VPDVNFGLAR